MLLTFCSLGCLCLYYNWYPYEFPLYLLYCNLLLVCLVFQYWACQIMLSQFLEPQRKEKNFVCYYILFLLYTCLIVLMLFGIHFSFWYLYFLLPPIAPLLPWEIIVCIYNGIMFPSLPVSTLYGTVITTWFHDVFFICCYFRKTGIKINGIDIHCFNVILLFLVSFLPYVVDHAASCPPLWNGSSCCTWHIFSHMPGNAWVGGMNHSIYIFFMGVLLAVCSFIPFCSLFLGHSHLNLLHHSHYL